MIVRTALLGTVGALAIGGLAIAGCQSSASTSAPKPAPVKTHAAAPATTTTPASTPTSTAPPPPPAAPKPTVEYIVTGTPGASVTYGPAGSDFNGAVPMDITAPLGSPAYYAINAQLQGGGSVSCTIKVDGKAISSATANGGFNIASCEVDQNIITGQWENTNNAGG